MKNIKLLFILLLAINAFGQLATMETLPFPVNYAATSNGGNSVAFVKNINSGDVIVVIESDEANATSPTITDTLGTTFTSKASIANSGCSGKTTIYLGTATSSGADTLSSTGTTTDMEIHGIAFNAVTSTADGTETSTWSSQTTVTTNAITTGSSRDLIIFANKDCFSGRQTQHPNSPLEWATSNWGSSVSDAMVAGWYIAGASGSETGSFTHIGSASNGSTVGLALKSTSSLQVATNNLADGVTGKFYKASLAATGGSGSYTWKVTSGALPHGLTLSGNIISGTPTATAPSCCTFQVKDGASTTQTKSLSITLGTSFNTPAMLHQGWPGSSTQVTMTVTTGNLIWCTVRTGPGSTQLGTVPVLSDTFGTVFAQLPNSIAMFVDEASGSGFYHRDYIGFAAGTGSDAISFIRTQNEVGCAEFSNVQKIYDTFAQNSTFTASGGGSPITSGTVSLPASDIIICSFMPGTGGATLGAGTGYTALTGNTGLAGEYAVSRPRGNNTCSFTESGNTRGDSALLFYGFRPTVSGAPAPVTSKFDIQPIIQANSESGTLTCTFKKNVTINDPLIIGFGSAADNATAIADTCGTSFTQIDSSAQGSGGTAYDWVGAAGCSGADTVTITASSSSANKSVCVELDKNLYTTTRDAHGTNTWFSPSGGIVDGVLLTPTINGGFYWTFFYSHYSGEAIYTDSFDLLGMNANLETLEGYEIGGLSGVDIYPSVLENDGSLGIGQDLALILRPVSGITIVPSSPLPSVKKTEPYYYPLAAIGGSGAYTWSISSGTLPAGISLDSATGVLSATAVTGKSKTFTVQVTDGTNTQTKSFTIIVNAAASTPSFVQAKSGTNAFTSVAVGDVILIGQRLDAGSNTSNVIGVPTDTLGTIYRFIGVRAVIYGASSGNMCIAFYIGTATSAGADTISGATGSVTTYAVQFRGVQAFEDNAVYTLSQSATSSTWTSNDITTIEANAMLWAYGTALSTVTPTAVSPFTDDGISFGAVNGEHNLESSVGTYAPQFSIVGNTQQSWDIFTIALRPTTTGNVGIHHLVKQE